MSHGRTYVGHIPFEELAFCVVSSLNVLPQTDRTNKSRSKLMGRRQIGWPRIGRIKIAVAEVIIKAAAATAATVAATTAATVAATTAWHVY